MSGNHVNKQSLKSGVSETKQRHVKVLQKRKALSPLVVSCSALKKSKSEPHLSSVKEGKGSSRSQSAELPPLRGYRAACMSPLPVVDKENMFNGQQIGSYFRGMPARLSPIPRCPQRQALMAFPVHSALGSREDQNKIRMVLTRLHDVVQKQDKQVYFQRFKEGVSSIKQEHFNKTLMQLSQKSMKDAWRSFGIPATIAHVFMSDFNSKTVSAVSFEQLQERLSDKANLIVTDILIGKLNALVTHFFPKEESGMAFFQHPHLFLSQYMMMAHPDIVFESESPLVLEVKAAAKETLSISESILNFMKTTDMCLEGLSPIEVVQLKVLAKQLNNASKQFSATFVQWQEQDRLELGFQLIAKYVEMEVQILRYKDHPNPAQRQLCELHRLNQGKLKEKVETLLGEDGLESIERSIAGLHASWSTVQPTTYTREHFNHELGLDPVKTLTGSISSSYEQLRDIINRALGGDTPKWRIVKHVMEEIHYYMSRFAVSKQDEEKVKSLLPSDRLEQCFDSEKGPQYELLLPLMTSFFDVMKGRQHPAKVQEISRFETSLAQRLSQCSVSEYKTLLKDALELVVDQLEFFEIKAMTLVMNKDKKLVKNHAQQAEASYFGNLVSKGLVSLVGIKESFRHILSDPEKAQLDWNQCFSPHTPFHCVTHEILNVIQSKELVDMDHVPVTWALDLKRLQHFQTQYQQSVSGAVSLLGMSAILGKAGLLKNTVFKQQLNDLISSHYPEGRSFEEMHQAIKGLVFHYLESDPDLVTLKQEPVVSAAVLSESENPIRSLCEGRFRHYLKQWVYKGVPQVDILKSEALMCVEPLLHEVGEALSDLVRYHLGVYEPCYSAVVAAAHQSQVEQVFDHQKKPVKDSLPAWLQPYESSFQAVWNSIDYVARLTAGFTLIQQLENASSDIFESATDSLLDSSLFKSCLTPEKLASPPTAEQTVGLLKQILKAYCQKKGITLSVGNKKRAAHSFRLLVSGRHPGYRLHVRAMTDIVKQAVVTHEPMAPGQQILRHVETELLQFGQRIIATVGEAMKTLGEDDSVRDQLIPKQIRTGFDVLGN